MYDAIEKGFDCASGDIYAWLNADDKYLPWAASVAVEHLTEPGVDWIIGHPARWDEAGTLAHVTAVRPHYNRRWIRRGWYQGRGLGWIQQESTFWTADLWESHGGFPEGVELAGDYHLWRQFAERTAPKQVGTVLAGYRVHDEQLSADMEAYYEEVPDIGLLPRMMGRLYGNTIYSWMYSIV